MPKGDDPHLKERYAADSLTPYGVGPWHTRGAVVGPCTVTVSSGHVKLQALALILMTAMATRTHSALPSQVAGPVVGVRTRRPRGIPGPLLSRPIPSRYPRRSVRGPERPAPGLGQHKRVACLEPPIGPFLIGARVCS